MARARILLLSLAALMVAACGETEEYPLPSSEATAMLAGLAQNPAVSPLPASLAGVTTRFEPLPDGKSVHWAFIGK